MVTWSSASSKSLKEKEITISILSIREKRIKFIENRSLNVEWEREDIWEHKDYISSFEGNISSFYYLVVYMT